MSDDITVTSINPDDDDPSSPSSTYNNLMASLAEHSYCASVISSSAEPGINDLFEITSSETLELGTDVSSSISFPVGIMGDVNLDGLDYPVPSMSANGNGNSIELENVWTGLNSDSYPAVVEIAATSSMDEREVMEEFTGSDEQSSAPPAKKSRKSNCRRKDFIQDSKKRKEYFDLYHEKLICQLHRIKCRTGCENSVSITFEGKNYDCERKTVNLTRGPLREDDVKAVSPNESKSCEMEDHRYAATMLTQNVQSSTVRDHQYDEKITEYDEDVDAKRPQTRAYKYDYLKIRWDRDQTLGKLVQSLFFSKIVLEQRTGASIKISLNYEGCAITEDNYESANAAIIAHRNRLKHTTFNLAPAPQKVSVPVQFNVQNTSSTPLTFILPNSYFGHLHPLPSSPESSMPLQDISLRAVSNDTDFPNPNQVTTFSILRNMQVEPVEDNPENTSILIPVDNEQESVSEVIMDGNSIVTSRASSPGFPPPEEDGDISELLVFPNSSSQNSPAETTVTVSREMKDSSTNTEPICSICSNSFETSTLTSRGRTGKQKSSTKTFWIRCNDPFCYDVVHASCVGFVVTHNSHLKQLPAFYCKLHR